MRLTLSSIKESRIPELLGVCNDDTARLAAYINDAQQRLIFAGSEAGWWQGWVKVRFTVQRSSPYLTLPREFARIINMAVDSMPVRIQNEFFEILPGGTGPLDETACQDWCGTVAGYERGVSPTTVDVTATNQKLRAYTTDSRDVGSNLIVTGLDQNGEAIYTTYGQKEINGFYMILNTPFVDTAFEVSAIKTVQKPITYGDVILVQVDQTTMAEVVLARYKASETNPVYRRYFIHPTPEGCCTTTGTFTVTALAKQEYIPAFRDSDSLIIGNLPALTEMVQALRYYAMDAVSAHALAEKHEKRALTLLRRELDHYMGNQHVAITVNDGAHTERLTYFH